MTKRWLSLVLVFAMVATLFSGAAFAEVAPKAAQPALTFVADSTAVKEYAAGEVVTGLAVGTFYADGIALDAIKSQQITGYLTTGRGNIILDGAAVTVRSAYVQSSKLYITFAAKTAGATGSVKFETQTNIEKTILKTDYDVSQLAETVILNAKVKAAEPTNVTITKTGAETFTGITAAVAISAKVEADGTELKDAKVVWTSSNASVATVAQTYSYDTLRAKVTPVSVGTTTIRATTTNGKYDEFTVVVNPATYSSTATVMSIDGVNVLAASAASIGQTYQMSTTISAVGATTGTANGSTAVKLTKWSSANTAIATIDAATGVLTPVAEGTTVITVASEDGKFSKTGSVTVGPKATKVADVTFSVNGKAASNDPYTTAVTVDLKSATEGATIKYGTAGTAETTGTSVTFSKNGTYTITAKASKLGMTDSAETKQVINVYIQPTALTLDKTEVAIDFNGTETQSFTITPTVAPDTAYVTVSNTTSDAAVVAKDATNANKFIVKGKGTATITYSTVATDPSKTPDSGAGYKLTAKCVVTISEVKPTALTASPETVEVVKGQTVKLDGVIAPDNATNKKVQYTIDTQDYAEIVATPGSAVEYADAKKVTGVTGGVYVYGKAVGTATITLVSAANTLLRKTVAVTVKDNTGVNKVNTPVFTPAGKVFTTLPASTVNISNPATYNGFTVASPMSGSTVYFTLDGTEPVVTGAKTYAPTATDTTYPTGTYIFDAITKVFVINNTTVNVRAIATKTGFTNSEEAYATFSSEIAVTGVTLDKTALAIEGKYASTVAASYGKLVATVAPTAAKNAKVAWSSSNEAIAKVVVPDSTKPLEAEVRGVAPGTAKITVTTEDGAKTASCTVTVSAVKVTGISATGAAAAANVNVNETVDLLKNITVAPTNASNAVLTWSSANPAIATVDEKGVVTGVSTNAAGNAQVVITARCENASTAIAKSATITVTVGKATGKVADITPLVDGVAPVATPPYAKEVTFTASTVTEGAKLYYTDDGSTPTASSTELPAAGVKVAKTTTIRVIAVKEGLESVYSSTTITITVNPTNVTIPTQFMAIGSTVTLAPVFTPANATYSKIVYNIKVADRATATVDDKGVVTAIKAGTVKVEATVTLDDKTTTIRGEGLIVVNNAPITSVTVTPATASVKVGDTFALNATIAPSTVTGAVVTWTSSDNTLATVAADGKVTAKKAGSVTITATAGGQSGTCAMTILPLEDSKVPTKMITYTPVKAFKAPEKSSLTAVLGTFTPGEGETWSQITDYFNVVFDNFIGVTATVNVDPVTGVATMTIPDVGKEDVTFSYRWRLVWKTEKGTEPVGNILVGTVRTEINNKLTISAVVTDEIKFEGATVDPIEGINSEIDKTVTLGKITNYADLIAKGYTLSATPSVTGTAWTAAIGTDGTVTLTVKAPEVGEYEATVTLGGKNAVGAELKSVVTGAVKVSAKAFEIKVENAILEPVTMFDNQTKTVEVAKVTNLAVLTAAGYTVSVEPYVLMTDKGVSVTVTEGWTAAIDALGAITITAKEPVVGIYQAQVKVSAANAAGTKLADVYTSKLAVTVEEEGYADIVVESGLYAFDAKGALNLAKSQLTGVKFVLTNGREATWSTNKPKFLSIAANGAATFNTKKGDKCIVTATYTDKSGEKKTVQETVKVVKVAAAFKFQSKKGTAKWKNFTSGVVNVDITGTPAVKVRLTGKHGPSAYIEWKAFESTAGDEIIKVNDIGTDCLITPQKIGTCTLMVSDFTGASKLLTVNVVADLKDVEPEAKTEKVADFIEIG